MLSAAVVKRILFVGLDRVSLFGLFLAHFPSKKRFYTLLSVSKENLKEQELLLNSRIFQDLLICRLSSVWHHEFSRQWTQFPRDNFPNLTALFELDKVTGDGLVLSVLKTHDPLLVKNRV